MKKSCLFSTTFFALTILASCGGADVAPAALVNAVKSLEGDFKTELVITSGRQYLNPWYSSNDFVNSIQVSQEYKLSEDKTYMHSKIYAYRDNLGTNIELLNSSGEYEVKTGLLVEETLNHKNEKVVTRLINASNSDFISLILSITGHPLRLTLVLYKGFPHSAIRLLSHWSPGHLKATDERAPATNTWDFRGTIIVRLPGHFEYSFCGIGTAEYFSMSEGSAIS